MAFCHFFGMLIAAPFQLLYQKINPRRRYEVSTGEPVFSLFSLYCLKSIADALSAFAIILTEISLLHQFHPFLHDVLLLMEKEFLREIARQTARELIKLIIGLHDTPTVIQQFILFRQ